MCIINIFNFIFLVNIVQENIVFVNVQLELCVDSCYEQYLIYVDIYVFCNKKSYKILVIY